MRRISIGLIIFATITSATFAKAQSERTSKEVMRSYGHSLDAELNGINLCSRNRLGSQTAATYQRAAENELAKIDAEMSRGSAIMAATRATNAIEGFSYCFVNDTREDNNVLFSGIVGEFLTRKIQTDAHSGLANSSGGLARIADAQILLAVLHAYGVEGSPAFEALAPVERPKVEGFSGAVSAISLVAEKKESSLRFKRNRIGKTLAVNGVIRDINERSSGKVVVTLLGYSNAATAGLGDIVTCHIPSGSPEIDRAIDLNKGDSVTVAGYMEKLGTFREPALEDCKIQ